MTTAIGQASIAVDEIDLFISGQELAARPRVDAHHFNLLDELREHRLYPNSYDHVPTRGTDTGAFAVHNYEDRSFAEIATHERLYMGHFGFEPLNRRKESELAANNVLGNFEERFTGFSEEQVVAEADRCLSCGMCFECDSCVIYCPQDAVLRVKKDEVTIGRYVYTDYDKCIGCHICMDVCPTGYIQMGLGE